MSRSVSCGSPPKWVCVLTPNRRDGFRGVSRTRIGSSASPVGQWAKIGSEGGVPRPSRNRAVPSDHIRAGRVVSSPRWSSFPLWRTGFRTPSESARPHLGETARPPPHHEVHGGQQPAAPVHQASSPRAGRPRSKRCGMTPSRSLCLRRSERLSERADGNTKRPTAKTTKATKKERCGPAKRGADTARFRLHDPRWSHERCASSFLSVLPFVVRNALPEGSHPFGLDVVLHDHQDQPDQDQRPADDHDNPNQSLGDCRHGQKDREDRE